MKESIAMTMDLIDKFTGPSKRIEQSLKGLDKELLDLNNSRQKASAIKSDLQQYDRLKTRLDTHTDKLKQVQIATSELGKEIAQSDNPTKKQIATFERSRKQLLKLRETNNAYKSDVHNLGKQLDKLGYGVTNMSLAHRKADSQLKQYDKSIIEHTKNIELNALKEEERKVRTERVEQYMALRNERKLAKEAEQQATHNRRMQGEALKHAHEMQRIERRMAAQKANLERLHSIGDQSLSNASGLGTTALAASGLLSAGVIASIAANRATFEDSALATGYGMSYDQFKANEFAATNFGLNGENIGDLAEEFKNKLGENGNKTLQEFSNYVGGFNFGNLAGMESQEQLLAITDAIAKIQDSDKRQYFYDAIMGGEAAKLSQGLDQAGKSYRQLYEESKRYNLSTKEGVEGAKASMVATNKLTSVLGSGFREVSGLVGGELTPLISQATNDFVGFYNENRTGIRDFVGDIGGAASSIYGFVTANSDAIITGSKLVVGLYAGVTAFRAVSLAVGAVVKGYALLKGGLAAASAAGGIFNAVMLANPVGVVVAGITAAGAALYALYTNWDSIVSSITSTIAWVKDALGLADEEAEKQAVKVLNSGHSVGANSGRPVSVTSNPTYTLHVNGNSDPIETAKAVRAELERKEAEDARKNRGAIGDGMDCLRVLIMIMASIGSYDFESDKNPFNELSESTRYEWASHSRYQAVEHIEFKGRKAKEVTFDIRIVFESEKDLKIVDGIEALANTGKPQQLLIVEHGKAKFMGLWAVTSISKSSMRYVGNTPFEQSARVTLREFAE